MQTARRPTSRLNTVITSCMHSDSQDAFRLPDSQDAFRIPGCFQTPRMRSDSQDAPEQLTVKPYRAVRPLPEILLCVRLRLHRLVRRASRGRAVSVMARL